MKNFVSSVSRLVRVAATVCLLTAFTGVGCCEESAMQFVALKNYAINDLALAPDGRILAATHAGAWEVDQDGRATPMTGTGLPRPMDKCFISGVAASGSGAVFIVVGSGGGGGVGVDGIFRLDPRGGSWQQVGKGVLIHPNTREGIESLSVLPDGTVFCTVRNVSIYRGESRPVKIFRSTDAGASWVDVSSLDPVLLHGGSLVAGKDRNLWAIVGGTEAGNPASCVLVAEDWRATPLKWRSPAGSRFSDYETVLTRLGVDRKGAAFALANEGRKMPFIAGVFRSMDKGESWQRLAGAGDTQSRNALVVTPDDHIYVSSYGGILRSLDGGNTWANYDGIGGTFVSDLLVDREGRLWAGTNSFGLQANNPGVFRSRVPVGTGMTFVAQGPSTPAPTTPSPVTTDRPKSAFLFDNFNAYGVSSGPSQQTTITLREAAVITRITDYHWNSGRGAKPGTIGLQGRNGRLFGPWQAHGASGQGGATDAYWICEPDIRLEAGEYVVIDSDWETWAQNPQSGGRGLTRVEGYPAR